MKYLKYLDRINRFPLFRYVDREELGEAFYRRQRQRAGVGALGDKRYEDGNAETCPACMAGRRHLFREHQQAEG